MPVCKFAASGRTAVVEATGQPDAAAAEVQLLYKGLAKRYRRLEQHFPSPVEMIEDLLVSLDTSDLKDFRGAYGFDPPKDRRGALVEVHGVLRSRQPFSGMSGKQANLLLTLQQAVTANNQQLAQTLIDQTADEFQVLYGQMSRQESVNRIAIVISIIGVILTLFFGAVSFIQFLSASPAA